MDKTSWFIVFFFKTSLIFYDNVKETLSKHLVLFLFFIAVIYWTLKKSNSFERNFRNIRVVLKCPVITVLFYQVIFMHFGSCHFKLINEQKKELYKNVLCHRFSTFITVCKTHKTERFVICSEPIGCDLSINSKTILTSLI